MTKNRQIPIDIEDITFLIEELLKVDKLEPSVTQRIHSLYGKYPIDEEGWEVQDVQKFNEERD